MALAITLAMLSLADLCHRSRGEPSVHRPTETSGDPQTASETGGPGWTRRSAPSPIAPWWQAGPSAGPPEQTLERVFARASQSDNPLKGAAVSHAATLGFCAPATASGPPRASGCAVRSTSRGPGPALGPRAALSSARGWARRHMQDGAQPAWLRPFTTDSTVTLTRRVPVRPGRQRGRPADC